MSGDEKLPPRDEDPLLIDSLRRHPHTDVGQSFGKDVARIVAETAGLPTEVVLEEVDQQRDNLHQINKITEVESEKGE